MKFLKPNSVSGEILNLLDEAKIKMVLVSPYCKFDKWFRLVNKIKDLRNRNVTVEFYIREGELDTEKQIKDIGFGASCIPNLHCKLYFNEKNAIVTSMNLLLSSEINSLEIGYKTETIEEYNEVLEFYSTYLCKVSTEKSINQSDLVEFIHTTLLEKIGTNRIYIDDDELININTKSNKYNTFIYNNMNSNRLRIYAIVSGHEYDYAVSIKDSILINNLEFEFVDGKNGYYNTIYGTFETNLKSQSILQITESELKLIIKPIVDFIGKIEEIKNFCYHNRKKTY